MQLFDEDRTDWFHALARAERGETPSLAGPCRRGLAAHVGGLAAGPAARTPAAPGSRPMPRTGGERRRTTLVEEAIRQFGSEGYTGASLDSIATAVGVRKQTLLYYFPNKDALLEACLAAAGKRRRRGDRLRARRRRPTRRRAPRP